MNTLLRREAEATPLMGFDVRDLQEDLRRAIDAFRAHDPRTANRIDVRIALGSLSPWNANPVLVERDVRSILHESAFPGLATSARVVFHNNAPARFGSIGEAVVSYESELTETPTDTGLLTLGLTMRVPMRRDALTRGIGAFECGPGRVGVERRDFLE